MLSKHLQLHVVHCIFYRNTLLACLRSPHSHLAIARLSRFPPALSVPRFHRLATHPFIFFLAAFARTTFLTMCIAVYVCHIVDIVVTAKQANSPTRPGDGSSVDISMIKRSTEHTNGCWNALDAGWQGFDTIQVCLLFVSTMLLFFPLPSFLFFFGR